MPHPVISSFERGIFIPFSSRRPNSEEVGGVSVPAVCSGPGQGSAGGDRSAI